MLEASPRDRQASGRCLETSANGWLFIGEEEVGIWRYGAEPGAPPEERVAVDRVGVGEPEGGHLASNVEGVSIYAPRVGGPDNGFLVASSQGNHTYVVYDRAPPHAYRGTFRVGEAGAVDGVEHTDGCTWCRLRSVRATRWACSSSRMGSTWPGTSEPTRTSSWFRGRTCSTPSTSPFRKVPVPSESEASYATATERRGGAAPRRRRRRDGRGHGRRRRARLHPTRSPGCRWTCGRGRWWWTSAVPRVKLRTVGELVSSRESSHAAEKVHRSTHRSGTRGLSADSPQAQRQQRESAPRAGSPEGRRGRASVDRPADRRRLFVPHQDRREHSSTLHAGRVRAGAGTKTAGVATGPQTARRRTGGADHRPASGVTPEGLRQLVVAAVGAAGRRVGARRVGQPRNHPADAKKTR